MYNYEQTEKVSVEHDTKMLSFEMPLMHTHTCHELYFLVSGQRRYLIGSDLFDVSPGNIILVPSGHLHRTTTINAKGHSRYVVYFFDGFMNDFITLIGRDAFDGLMQKRCLQLPDYLISTIHDLLRQMDQTQKQGLPFAEAALKTDLQQLLLYLLHYGKKKDLKTTPSAIKIQEATQYISEHYADDITLMDVAAVACMEKTYFCKCFKAITGFGFSEYLTRIRMQTAEGLLLKTDLTVSEIASQCGFSGSNYFGDVFRRFTELSPTQYRKKYRL